jgi:hypothetical protein
MVRPWPLRLGLGRFRAVCFVGDVGELLVEWAKLEERLLPRARQLTERNVSTAEALRALAKQGDISDDMAESLDRIRRVRNIAAHTPGQIKLKDMNVALRQLRELVRKIPDSK